jgi:DNA-binding transcriptional MerR regulator
MQGEESQLTIEELAERVGVPVRTVRYYIVEGLLPGPGARGKAATYTAEHLLRLALVRRLVDGHVPLREIRERLSSLSAEEIRALLAEETQRGADLRQSEESASPREHLGILLQRARLARVLPAPASPQRSLSAEGMDDTLLRETAAPLPLGRPSRPQSTERELGAWRRLELAPGLELHVREDAEVRQRDLIQRILQSVRAMGRSTGR